MTTKENRDEELIRCKNDIVYFANKYCKIITSEGVKDVQLRPYQVNQLRQIEKQTAFNEIRNIRTGRSSLEDYVARHYTILYNELMNPKYDFCKSIKERIYCYFKGISEAPVCRECGSQVKFHGYDYGYAKFCSSKCARLNEDSINKYKSTSLSRYGVDCPMRSEEIKARVKRRCIEKYGVDNAMKSEEIKDKLKSTMMSKYGVDNPMKSEVFRNKAKDTCRERYNSDYYLTSDGYRSNMSEHLNKRDITCIDKYGAKSPMQNDEVERKVNETCVGKYGVKWNCMRDEARNSRNMHSSANEAFAKLLDDKGISYEREICLDGYSYDFKVGDILIEINPSPTHNINWSPFSEKNNVTKDYHSKKSDVGRRHGYSVIHAFDWDDLNLIVDIVSPSKEVLYARKCDVIRLTKKECDEFLNENHLQKTCKGQTIRLALKYKDKIVQVMTFGKPRYNTKYDYELLRLCTLRGYAVIGGAERLFKHFTKEIDDKTIVSYCDSSKYDGSVYYRLGFSLSERNRPSRHWYNIRSKDHITDNLLRYRGFDQIFGTSYGKYVSNDELMREHGYVEIYDCGQMTFAYKNIGNNNEQINIQSNQRRC